MNGPLRNRLLIFGLFVSVISHCPEAASLAAEPAQPVTFAPSDESIEAAISRTVYWALRDRKNIYFVFQNEATECGTDGLGRSTIGDIYLTKHGILLFNFVPGGSDFSMIRNPNGHGLTATIKSARCMMNLNVDKLVRTRDETWVSVEPALTNEIKGPSERETKLMSTGILTSKNSSSFLFNANDDETCPSGGGWAFVWKTALLSEMGGRFTSSPIKSGPYDRQFEIAGKNCKYQLKVTFFTETKGTYIALPARHLGGSDFDQ